MQGSVEAGGSPVPSPTVPSPTALCSPHPLAHHTWEKGDTFSSMFPAVTGSIVCNTCSGLLSVAFVVYRGVVGCKMGLDLLGQIRNSRLKWKTSYGRLWSAGSCSSCRTMWLSQNSLKYFLMVFPIKSHASPGQD